MRRDVTSYLSTSVHSIYSKCQVLCICVVEIFQSRNCPVLVLHTYPWVTSAYFLSLLEHTYCYNSYLNSLMYVDVNGPQFSLKQQHEYIHLFNFLTSLRRYFVRTNISSYRYYLFPYTWCLITGSIIGQRMILDEEISGKERIKFVHLRLGSRENQVGKCVGYACTQTRPRLSGFHCSRFLIIVNNFRRPERRGHRLKESAYCSRILLTRKSLKVMSVLLHI